MIRLLADEDIHGDIVRGIRRRDRLVDLVRVQDVGLAGELDPAVLEWAFRESRVVVTHDANTMTAAAYERVSAGQPLFGVLVVSQSMGIGAAIEEILLAAICSNPEEWQNQVRHAPL